MMQIFKRRRMQLAVLHAIIGAAGTAWQFYTPGGIVWIPLAVFCLAVYIGILEGVHSRKGPRNANEES